MQNTRFLSPWRWLTLAAVLLVPRPDSARGEGLPGYAGSVACRDCHEEIYAQWSLTPHARMRRDAKLHPEAILADKFSPDIPFTKDDIYYTLGSHWIQKYLTMIDGRIYVLPKVWNIVNNDWEQYSIFNWRSKVYSKECYGCHTVGTDPATLTHTEDSVGCEACHGPGAKHAESEEAGDIVNPARLSKRLADMVCEACHTHGTDKLTGELPFPAGFQPGKDLTDYYEDFFIPMGGTKNWYKGDSTYRDRHRMFMFFQTRLYSRMRACNI
jgi:hypothetical protein